jgi:hypothetical protein
MKRLSFVTGLVAVSLGLLATSAVAQIEYGPWRQTSQCRPASPPAGPGRGRVTMPYAPGGSAPMECTWEREVRDCPRFRDNVRHPIRCSTGRQRSGYSQFQPRN